MKIYKMMVFSLALMLVIGSVAFVAVGIDFSSETEMNDEEVIIGSGTRDDPVMIYDVDDLQDMAEDLSGHYALANDIDASETAGWNDGAGFEPVGTGPFNEIENHFTGSLDGNNYTISNLYIDRDETDYIGLFGCVSEAEIKNLGLIDVDITGGENTGSLVGLLRNGGMIENVYSTGVVSGQRDVGGLIGLVRDVGTRITDTHSTVDTTGSSLYVGGLVGSKTYGVIERSYATGDVSGDWAVGGLVGSNSGQSIIYSYATGNVFGRSNVGGFVGITSTNGNIFNCYSTGTVTRTTGTATDLAGFSAHNSRSRIINCYSTGPVYWQDSTQPSDRGFLATVDTDGNYEMTGNFWDVETSGQTSSTSEGAGNVTGMTTAEMKTRSTFTDAGWDFDDIWWMSEGQTYPVLRAIAGHGTEEYPYVIFDVDDLQNMRNDLSAHYILANDIDASETVGWNDGDGFLPIGDGINPFTGGLDGNNYTINGLHINRPSTTRVGLFGQMYGAVVENLRIFDASIDGAGDSFNQGTGILAGTVKGDSFIKNVGTSGTVTQSIGDYGVGGLVGIVRESVTGTTIIDCYSTAEVYAPNSQSVGGLIGYARQPTGPAPIDILNSYSSGDVTGADEVGGFIGRKNIEGVIMNSYATGTVTRATGASENIGGFIGMNFQTTIINCYSTGSVHFEGADDPTDNGFVGFISTGGNFEMTGNFWDIDTSGQTNSAGEDSEVEGKTTSEMMSQDTFVGWDFDDVWMIMEGQTYPLLRGIAGHGTEDYPYIIFDVDDLQNMRDDLSAHYMLANDIDASVTVGWNDGVGFEPVGTEDHIFTGSLDGNNFTISNLYIDRDETDYIGLFGYVSGAEIKNLGLIDVDITGADYTGSLFGRGMGVFSNVYSTGEVSGGNHVGGLIGFYLSSSTLSDSYSTVKTTGSSYNVGGLVGRGDGTIVRCHASGNVTGTSSVGGFIGLCHSIGGVVQYSFSTGDVSGREHVGGFAGRTSHSSITNSYSIGTVTRTTGIQSTFGGFTGSNYRSKIINCYSTGPVYWQDSTQPSDRGFLGSEDTGGHYEMTGNFWDMDTSGQTETIGNATGKTTAEMMTQSTFTGEGWDFTDNWWMVDGETRPFLQMEYSTEIQNSHQLQLMAMDLNADYTLVADIDLTPDMNNNASMWGTDADEGRGFVPIGTSSNRFTGSLEGHGNTVSGLYINRPETDQIGLFGTIGSQGTVSGVGLLEGEVIGESYVGLLAGSNFGTVEDSYSTGSVIGNYRRTGGLIGNNEGGIVRRCYSTADVTGADNVAGGLVGMNIAGGNIIDSYAHGDVTGASLVGGLSGNNYQASISRSYATGNVNGTGTVGGLSGGIFQGSVLQSFYDLETTGCSDTGRGEPKTTAEMKTQSTFTDADWDFDDLWHMMEGLTYPLFQWQPFPDLDAFSIDLTVTADNDGWNFVSYNLLPEDSSLEAILADIEGSYDQVMWYQSGIYEVEYETIFFDNGESGGMGFTYSTSHAEASEWDLRDHDAYSGSFSYDFGDGLFNKNTSYGMSSWLISPEIDLIDANSPVLTFQHWRDWGDTALFDAGNVKISTDGTDGPWTLIIPEEGYDGTVPTDWDNPLGGEEAYGGIHYWTQATFDLSGFEGETIHIGWFAGVDNWDGDYGAGWRVDNIEVRHIIDETSEPDSWYSFVPDRAEHFNTFLNWDHTMGVWIQMNSDVTLTVSGIVPVSTDITLQPGWNMVGLPSESSGNHGLPGEVDRIGYFEASDEYNLVYDYDPENFIFEPGQGYWIYNGADHSVVWNVEY